MNMANKQEIVTKQKMRGLTDKSVLFLKWQKHHTHSKYFVQNNTETPPENEQQRLIIYPWRRDYVKIKVLK